WSRPRPARRRRSRELGSPASVNNPARRLHPLGSALHEGSQLTRGAPRPPCADPTSQQARAWRPSPPAARSWPPTTTTGAAWVPLPATAPAAVPSAPGKLFPTPQVSAGPPLSPPAPARSWQHQDPISLLSGLPKADPGHWWASLFFGKSTLPFMATVLESAEHSEPPQASSSMTTCGLARDAPRKPPGGQSSTASAGPPS
uniref:Pancreatic progenitor cell differentiation and proliferation factor n=1 Tax=Pongo abelii TaxID=9601 RepID=H2P2L9_PONAB